MATLAYGYANGVVDLRKLPVDSTTADIKAGDILTHSGGYVLQASPGDAVVGFAAEDVDSPSADGGAHVLVDIGIGAVYRYPINTGSVAESNRFSTADAGGAQSVDVTSPSNNDLLIVDVDTVAGVFYVRRNS